MEPRTCRHRSGRRRWPVWILGLGSLVWLLLRSGTNPRRLAYPCQRAALASGVGFVAYLISLLGMGKMCALLGRRTALSRAGLVTAFLVLTLAQWGGQLRSAGATTTVALDLPGWTSPTAVSDVFVVPDAAVPQCSLAGGALPATPPCNDPSVGFADAGVDRLVDEMERRGAHFYATSAHPDGVVGSDDVVVLKVNNQWGAQGDGDGFGRLTTNTDLLKGLTWSILQHPDGFTGEVVVAENTQYVNPNWETTPANAQDQQQTFQAVVAAFRLEGFPVSVATWDYLNDTLFTGGSVGGGTPPGEYANGNDDDGYVLLEDPAGGGADELSYPKFQTGSGHGVSLRYGVWTGSGYDRDRLTLINLPVLKKHGMAGSTIAWKNLIGLVTIADDPRRYGNWDRMHDFYWGYLGGSAQSYGLIGRQLALVSAPDLNIVDAIWVATQDNTSGNAVRANALVASTDPFAVDWYASEYILRPVAEWDPNDSSAARAGTFRNATRTNQNSALLVWPGGGYPWIDLLDSYDGGEPSLDERNQMNAYVAGGGAACSLSCSAEVPTQAAQGEPVPFQASATATGCSGTPAFSWDFGDGETAAGQNVTHAYSQGDQTYGWTLTVTADDQTCTDGGSIAVDGGPPPTYGLLVPAVVHNPGAAGTQWRTSLALLNPGPGPASVELTLVTGGASVSESVTLDGGTSVEWVDVVVELFGQPASASTAGAVHLAADGAVLATSRTYNQAASGTYGQYLPALSTDHCLGQGETGYLLQLTGNDDFRTNIGFANLGDTAVNLRVQLHDDSGTTIGNPLVVTVDAGAWSQVNDVFLASDAGPHDLAWATVEVQGTGTVWAYASVVDNRTGDATTIPVLVQ